MKIGVIASSGGSAFASALRIIRGAGNQHQVFLVTDRPCGIERLADSDGVVWRRIEEPDNAKFSSAATEWFRGHDGVDFVVLYFVRLVTDALFRSFPCFNIHPSLLPAFAGLSAVERAAKRSVRFLGATLHLVDATADTGPILAQTVMPVQSSDDDARLHKSSYVQKVYLTTLLVHWFESGQLSLAEDYRDAALLGDQSCTDRCNPLLTHAAYWNDILALQAHEGVEVIR